ncbi:MAG: hypothetical protein HYV07_24820 [Deltaproteobacteria bacterium]|nr:hypothetical protein [Deltaproteobacteria bacterium]
MIREPGLPESATRVGSSRRLIARVGALALGVAGCGPTPSRLDPPPFDASTRAAIFAFHEEGSFELHAREIGDSRFETLQVEVTDAAEVSVLAYAVPLEALELEAGRLVPSPPGQPGSRPLPRPVVTFAGEGDRGLWTTSSASPEWISNSHVEMSPRAVRRGDPVFSVSAGRDFTCAVRDSGKVFCFGSNYASTIKVPSSVLEPPTELPWAADVGSVAAGRSATCVRLRDGRVACWGSYFGAEEDDGVEYVEGLDSALSVVIGTTHACSVDSSAAVSCWGLETHAEIDGDPAGPSRERYRAPVKVPLPGPVSEVATGRDHTCALIGDGTVWCWGRNSRGQLGNGAIEDSAFPPRRVVGIGEARRVYAAGDTTCVEAVSGAWCFGSNAHGQLADSRAATESPVLVDLPSARLWLSPTALCGGSSTELRCQGDGSEAGGRLARLIEHGFVELSMSEDHACAVDEVGSLWCVGRNETGQVGLTPLERGVSERRLTTLTGASRIWASRSATCGLVAGRLSCVGYWGPLGSAPVTEAKSLELGGELVEAAVDDQHVCGRARTSSVVSCLGTNEVGQLGSIGLPGGGPYPVEGLPPSVQLTSSNSATCSRDEDGVVTCWGNNDNGAIGVDFLGDATPPTRIDLPEAAVDVGLGYGHGCAVGISGRVYCWGDRSPALGYDAVGTSGPHEVPSLPPVKSLGVGEDHNCVVSTDRRVFCWGEGEYASLGIPNVRVTTEPREAPNAGPAEWVVAGIDVTFVKRTDGSVLMFGGGSARPSSEAFRGAVSIASGAGHACALDDRGELTCWGASGLGQLGESAPAYLSEPVLVPVP